MGSDLENLNLKIPEGKLSSIKKKIKTFKSLAVLSTNQRQKIDQVLETVNAEERLRNTLTTPTSTETTPIRNAQMKNPLLGHNDRSVDK